MIFKEIRITNLFSYFGEQVFELPEPTTERPLILISGRNGFGKTSFINSVKLLFLGTSTGMLQRVIEGTKLRPNSYLLGHGKEWRGIFNRRARELGNTNTRYGVQIAWQEEQGLVIAQRYWTLIGNDVQHHLHIETDFDTDFDRVIDDEDNAEEFLERRLPKSVVPFSSTTANRCSRLPKPTGKVSCARSSVCSTSAPSTPSMNTCDAPLRTGAKAPKPRRSRQS